MNKKEFAIFTDALKTYYPKEQILPNPQSMDLWYQELKDIPFQIASLALRKWVATNKWSPSISDLRSKLVTIHWEAYEQIAITDNYEMLSEEERKLYRWIYEQTMDFKQQKFIEPSIRTMLNPADFYPAITDKEALMLE